MVRMRLTPRTEHWVEASYSCCATLPIPWIRLLHSEEHQISGVLCPVLPRSVACLEALRQKRDFVGGAVGGALAGTAFGVPGKS